MGYYTRVLSTASNCAPLSAVKKALADSGLDVQIAEATGGDAEWSEFVLQHSDETPIALISRNEVQDDSLAAEEIEEFEEELSESEPRSGAEWVVAYLKNVKTIFAIQILAGGAERDNGWNAIEIASAVLSSTAPSIHQADGEGFTNEEGDYIVWQFDDDVEDDCAMAIWQGDHWTRFTMNLGNREHRAAFLSGKLPQGLSGRLIDEE